MKPSTLFELLGFAALTYAAWRWDLYAGLITAGIVFLLLGFSTDDDSASLAVGRIVNPIVARLKREKSKAPDQTEG